MEATDNPEQVIAGLLARVANLKQSSEETQRTQHELEIARTTIAQLEDENSQLKADAIVQTDFKVQIADLTTQIEVRDNRLKILEMNCNDLLGNLPQDTETSKRIVEAVVNTVREANNALQPQLDMIPMAAHGDSPESMSSSPVGDLLGIQTMLSNLGRVIRHFTSGQKVDKEKEQPDIGSIEVNSQAPLLEDILMEYQGYGRNDLIREILNYQHKIINANDERNDALKDQTRLRTERNSWRDRAELDTNTEDLTNQLAETKRQLEKCMGNGKAFQKEIKRLQDRLKAAHSNLPSVNHDSENVTENNETLHKEDMEILTKELNEALLVSLRFKKKVLHLQQLLGHVLEGGVLGGGAVQHMASLPSDDNGDDDDYQDDMDTSTGDSFQQQSSKEQGVDDSKEPEGSEKMKKEFTELKKIVAEFLQGEHDMDLDLEIVSEKLSTVKDNYNKKLMMQINITNKQRKHIDALVKREADHEAAIYIERQKCAHEKVVLQSKIDSISNMIKYAQAAGGASEGEKQDLMNEAKEIFLPAMTSQDNEKKDPEQEISKLSEKLRRCRQTCSKLVEEAIRSRNRPTRDVGGSPSETSAQIAGLRKSNRFLQGQVSDIQQQLNDAQNHIQNLQNECKVILDENESYGTTLIRVRQEATKALQQEKDLREQHRKAFEKQLEDLQDNSERVQQELQAKLDESRKLLDDCEKFIDDSMKDKSQNEQDALKQERQKETMNFRQKWQDLEDRCDAMRKSMQAEINRLIKELAQCREHRRQQGHTDDDQNQNPRSNQALPDTDQNEDPEPGTNPDPSLPDGWDLPDYEYYENQENEAQEGGNLPDNSENPSTLRRIIRLERRRVAGLESRLQTLQGRLNQIQGPKEARHSRRPTQMDLEDQALAAPLTPARQTRASTCPLTPSRRLPSSVGASRSKKKRKLDELLLEQAKGFMNFPDNIPLKGPAR